MKRLLLLLPFLLLAANADTHSRCYKCASLHVIMNWHRYFGVLNEMESIVEESCVNDTAVHEFVRCKGSCLTLNITGTTKSGNPYVAGVLRGCETHFWRKAHNVSEGEKECLVRNKEYRGREYTAEYCFCRGNHCNGPKPESPEFKAARLQKRPYRRGETHSLTIPVLIFPLLYILHWL
ncbi:hypothetical protein QR680_008584 [Steinernema hermaphroditum]|uniref:Protein quiver n=1 Tax=Steinernema hermaphroditum TaxID=289476 RepID=A0AA39IH64_9BILA|nr:hypothetical protein QR680_008584 [Steinernema hermaphroditum]